ncbi:NUDIX hydrolase [Herbiconiux ginsengi]|uniref:8-oxo-dGTP pyrophosphatase MutT, NUDIX family n=1 Tax=Herbiconiux ginsengi TaxID=381665 RepID=A0A1H3QMQ0_9MICO|nr:NUDIX domain-containing protein [Herbiconiux ginsengi]SDZ14667.1 8-oxo-dGTP pyrophosphatase MutT, NUDIX family [Herbiconiux ginsengi]
MTDLTEPQQALYASALEAVRSVAPLDDADRATRMRVLGFFETGPSVVGRHPHPVHATASAFVFDAERRHVLLCFHKKGRFWVQPGGHLEPGDATVIDGAVREAREETGAEPPNDPAPTIVDVDAHRLSSRFGHCAEHLDIGVSFTADPTASLRPNDEVEGVRWWPVDALPDDAAAGLDVRIGKILQRLSAR